MSSFRVSKSWNRTQWIHYRLAAIKSHAFRAVRFEQKLSVRKKSGCSGHTALEILHFYRYYYSVKRRSFVGHLLRCVFSQRVEL